MSLPTFDRRDHPDGGRTSLDYVRPLVVTTLSRLLLPEEEDWMKWAGVVQDYYGNPKYRMGDIRMMRVAKNPVDSIWRSLSTDARDLNYVLETLSEAGLYAAADFISVNVLGGEKIRPPPRPQPTPPVLQEAPAPGDMVPPPTAEFIYRRDSDSDITGTSLNSTDPKDFADGDAGATAVKSNIPVATSPKQINTDSPGWNIQTSDEQVDSNSKVEHVGARMHEMVVESPKPQKLQPAFGENAPTPPPASSGDPQMASMQEQIRRQIEAVMDMNESNLEPGKPRVFQYLALKYCSENFDKKPLSQGGRLIGKGGFGDVFLGTLRNDRKVAVKRIKNQNQNAAKQFKAEIESMSWMKHPNLLPFFGYSEDDGFLCIVYEYMPKGSLEDALACRDEREPLRIKQRLEIAVGTSKGIAHLHNKDPPLTHRDIKSANILLSDDLTPRIGDFGLARPLTISVDQKPLTSDETTTIIGTRAYMPPEAFDGKVSPAWDCYSMGVVILELITGLRAFDSNREDSNLKAHVHENCDSAEEVLSMADPRAGTWNLDLVTRLYALANTCCLESRNRRCAIGEIEETLEKLCSA